MGMGEGFYIAALQGQWEPNISYVRTVLLCYAQWVYGFVEAMNMCFPGAYQCHCNPSDGNLP